MDNKRYFVIVGRWGPGTVKRATDLCKEHNGITSCVRFIPKYNASRLIIEFDDDEAYTLYKLKYGTALTIEQAEELIHNT